MNDLPEIMVDCDGQPLRSEYHLWSANTLIAFDAAHEDDEGNAVVGQMNGRVKHCEKCGAVRFFPETERLDFEDIPF